MKLANKNCANYNSDKFGSGNSYSQTGLCELLLHIFETLTAVPKGHFSIRKIINSVAQIMEKVDRATTEEFFATWIDLLDSFIKRQNNSINCR